MQCWFQVFFFFLFDIVFVWLRRCGSFLFFFFFFRIKGPICSLCVRVTQSSLSWRFSLVKALLGVFRMSAQLHCGLHSLLLSSLGVQHFNEQVVAGHVAVQVFVVKVFFRLQADGSDLRQPEEQLAKLVRLLWIVAHDVVQQCCVDLLLDTFYQVEVLQVLYIYEKKQRKDSIT